MTNRFKLALATGAALTAVQAQAAITVTGIDRSTYATNRTDIFDESAGATIVASTPIGVGPREAAIGRAAGDALESLIFADFNTLNQSFTLRTPSAVTVSGFNLFLLDDSQFFPNSPDRTFLRVSVSGSTDGTNFTLLESTALTQYFQTYGSPLIRVSATFAPGTYQFFRFDGLGSPSVGLSGGRVVELDGVSGTISGAVPEPATWATMILGFGLVGGTMRRRRGAPALA